PHARELPEVLRGRAELVTLEDALARADAFALLVDHRAFAGLRLSDLRGRPFTDTRGMVRS
ncbi:MAG: UDP-N-acetyl-D-mannosamine dehydrogenase, partial [Verrucomicrobiota bacterium]